MHKVNLQAIRAEVNMDGEVLVDQILKLLGIVASSQLIKEIGKLIDEYVRQEIDEKFG